MRTIRASEIGTYLYCQRAWGYQKQGHLPNNHRELSAGTDLHFQHSKKVMVSGLLRVLGYLLLIVSIVLLAIYTTIQLI